MSKVKENRQELMRRVKRERENKTIERIEDLIFNQMYDFEEAYLIANKEMSISYRQYLELRQVYQ